MNACGNVRSGFDEDPIKAANFPNDGLHLIARSQESIRRIPKEHGVFVWSIGYRLTEDGEVRANAVSGFHMAFDKRIHTFDYELRDGEKDTALRDITPEILRAHLDKAVQFYEDHADAGVAPF